MNEIVWKKRLYYQWISHIALTFPLLLWISKCRLGITEPTTKLPKLHKKKIRFYKVAVYSRKNRKILCDCFLYRSSDTISFLVTWENSEIFEVSSPLPSWQFLVQSKKWKHQSNHEIIKYTEITCKKIALLKSNEFGMLMNLNLQFHVKISPKLTVKTYLTQWSSVSLNEFEQMFINSGIASVNKTIQTKQVYFFLFILPMSQEKV